MADARFPFGRNWASFLRVLDEDRIREAERSLVEMLGADVVAGATVVDVGSGSGLFSLAAMRLGAARVHSFDYDTDSVGCTAELRRRYFPAAGHWTVEQGSVLDPGYLARLGRFDVVYSWGVLHHTGAMWQAIDLASGLVAPGGRFFIAIYNDQGPWSRFWTAVKRFYNRGALQRWLVEAVFMPYWIVRGLLVDLLVRRTNPWRRYQQYRTERGMTMFHDWRDWLGGYPFEVASPEAVFEFAKARGFVLDKLKTRGGTVGCNEFVFVRATTAEGAGA
jgi:2-polyprenyl-6-hydroxyphenyl methylase/3-demethylubiquinone-9 3-methyltransferase